MMILSGRFIEQKDLQYTKGDERILHQRHIFVWEEQLHIKTDMDCSYLVFDTNRNACIRASMAEMMMKRREKEHVSTSLRISHISWSSKFYLCYPNPKCDKVYIPDVDLTIGSFIQLGQLISIWLQKDKVEDIAPVSRK